MYYTAPKCCVSIIQVMVIVVVEMTEVAKFWSRPPTIFISWLWWQPWFCWFFSLYCLGLPHWSCCDTSSSNTTIYSTRLWLILYCISKPFQRNPSRNATPTISPSNKHRHGYMPYPTLQQIHHQQQAIRNFAVWMVRQGLVAVGAKGVLAEIWFVAGNE